MRRAAAVLAVPATLALTVAWRAARLRSRQLRVPPAPALALDAGALGARLSEALRFRTVSTGAGPEDPAAFEAFHAFLARSFPRVHHALRLEKVGLSLLYTWPGRRPELPAVALLAHQDVVPAGEGWRVPPFEGRLQGGFVWGRGALDDKGSLVAILEAAEALLAEGFVPERTVVLAFGADEEVGGREGAGRMAALLAARGLRLASVLDEGEVVGEGLVPGVAAPVALVGTAEKGYLSVALVVEGPGGHSSMPPRETPAGILGAALARLEARPFPARFTAPVEGMFEALAPEMHGAARVAFANRGLFRPLLVRELSAAPGANALVRTTAAPTMLEGGPKENVLPARVRAVVNLRVLPGETTAQALEGLRARIRDPRVRLEPLEATRREPTPVSDPGSPAFAVLARSIREVMPEAVVAPTLVLGGTDAARYQGLSAEVYRFLPFRATGADLARFHGKDERLSLADYLRGVRFYARYLRNAAGSA